MAEQASSNGKVGTNVKVAIRCRPPNAEEKAGNHASVVSCNQQSKQVSVNYGGAGKKTQKAYSFDKVFGMYSTQEEVFDSMVQPIVEETLAGFNCTIFAYGQTGTGKTHTMEGDIYSPENAGIVPRSVRAILEQLETRGAEFTIRVSFLELYNEELQDLLTTEASAKDKGALRLCEDIKKGVVCQNLEEITVLNVQDIFEILKRGIKQRQTAATLCNKNSSRSHSIFTMKIMIKETNVEGEEVIRNGQLNLVDLAGSECVGRSGAKNARAREAGSINQSLLTLGRVITALVDHHGHIPYRDSKLTRLLQESLGGKAKTCIIATLSPSQLAVEESLSTLDYASKAKSIKNVPQVNQKMTKKTVMKEYCAEIESLRNMLQITREKNGIYVDPATFENMEARLSSQELQITECEGVLQQRSEEIKTIRAEVDVVRGQCEEAQAELGARTIQLEETERNLKEKTQEARHCSTEWQAAEAVVSEQTTTEASLAAHVATLQQKVTSCEGDISGLFGKIDRHSSKEKERMAQTEKYSSEVSAKQNALIDSITHSLSQTQTQSQELCDGVGSMLEKGKNVCSEFEASIAKALVVLVGDTTVAKDSMVQSCSGLENTLSSTQEEVIGSLKTLQSNLSSWLGEVQSNMANTQAVLARQQTSLQEFKGAITASSEEFEAKNMEFVEVQKKFSAALVSDMTELKADVSDNVASFREDMQQQADASKAELRKKSQALQRAMTDMLGDLVDTQDQHTDKVAARTEEFSTAITASTNKNVEKVVSVTNTANASILELNAVLLENTKKSSEQFHQMVKDSQNIREDVEAKVRGVADTVGDKREFLDQTATTLSASVSQSMASAQVEVQKTSSTAEDMVSGVTSASSKMQASCSESMASFTDFLGGKGEEISAELANHFTGLESTLSEDKKVVQALTSDSSEFLATAQGGVLLPTGTTPAKKAPSCLREVESTRPHEDIKGEARSNEAAKLLDAFGDENDSATCEVLAPSVALASPSKTARVKEDHAVVQEEESDVENVAPVVNIQSSSADEDDDQSSVSSKGSSSSVTSRGVKRVSSRPQLRAPKTTRASSRTVN